MKFTRLRLSGFKSFVEPTELFIEPGLTAVIGPNGCGKSNLFDAMRWVMGETRPSSVRGSEMDDVIFSGSAGRPARNVAEVTLFIDNADRKAGGAYADFDTIEVSRRIEREAGSVYRINGRDVRQRDVQIFFADASSGAGSTAFVRQGQIGLLISQKPLARRAILEEAAGIGGLHQRRHEAELRLRAAETNLSRLEDVIREVEGQLASLKRQARQASRYRNLSGHIRKAEALAHYPALDRTPKRAPPPPAEELAAAAAAVATRHRNRRPRLHRRRATPPPVAAAAPGRSGKIRRASPPDRAARTAGCRRSPRPRSGAALPPIASPRATPISGANRRWTRMPQAALAHLVRRTARRWNMPAPVPPATSPPPKQQAAELQEKLAEAERLLEKLTAEFADWNANKASQERGRDLAAGLAETSAAQLGDARARLDRAMEGAHAAPDVAAADSHTEAAARSLRKRARRRRPARGSARRSRSRGSRRARAAGRPPNAKCSAFPPK